MNKKKNIWDGNTIYVLWFIFYFLLTSYIISLFTLNILKALFITLAIYIILISLAFTTAGEKLFKLLNGVRPLYTNHEKEKILPIFHEVHKDLMKKENFREPILNYVSAIPSHQMHTPWEKEQLS